ncbi:MAG TPA: ornithine carbamoyltransferase [Planctomycetes bacterium]|nr:ornithine carbamoyltransferase [Planctomycetaceae bacterium]HIN96075.1 ornithine carbamoyltransferase [Planctomycetota bacterium]
MPRNLITLFDLTTEELNRILTIGCELKQQLQLGERPALLQGRGMALLFEKPSLRTRVSFEMAIGHLGGNSLFLGDDVGWGSRESMQDFSRVLSQYVDIIVSRCRGHEKVVELANHASCSVVNGLTDYGHPCQALADILTLKERQGELAGQRLAYVGDANNVARSLAIICGKLGVDFLLAAPEDYQFEQEFLDHLGRELPDFQIHQTTDPRAAVENANAIYTDVWASMGQEAETAARAAAFQPFQVNAALMQAAPMDACFLHCLPARRGQEVTDEVIDGEQSLVIEQAANRMHAQKGLLVWLLNEAGSQ